MLTGMRRELDKAASKEDEFLVYFNASFSVSFWKKQNQWNLSIVDDRGKSFYKRIAPEVAVTAIRNMRLMSKRYKLDLTVVCILQDTSFSIILPCKA